MLSPTAIWRSVRSALANSLDAVIPTALGEAAHVRNAVRSVHERQGNDAFDPLFQREGIELVEAQALELSL